MICLLNVERVIKESVELAALKIAKVMHVDRGDIGVQVSVAKGDGGIEINPKFILDDGVDPGPLEKQIIEKEMSRIWGEVRPLLVERLKGLNEVRRGEENCQGKNQSD